ncbi:DUF4041 domain-containing protein [Endozoicomonas sp. ALB032]|uniref:DUF4041 domain-containing protein n=1 Tax=Endozoicomonas sp. ALB032 TaxID=3403082 RepID=UPI003BB7A6F9
MDTPTVTALLILLAPLGIAALFWWKNKQSTKKVSELQSEKEALLHLKKYEAIVDAESEARNIISQARNEAEEIVNDAAKRLNEAELQAESRKKEANVAHERIVKEARENLKKAKEKAELTMQEAFTNADKIVKQAEDNAREIAGEALEAKSKADTFEKKAKAMKNIIDGYGNEYLIANQTVLDDLAEEFSHKDAGVELKKSRYFTKTLVTKNRAAICDYAEVNRKETAIRFVLDAFNGKVDTALAKVKHDNYGKLEAEIKDAFALVNGNGRAFRNARIADEYLNARLDELKWAVTVNELKLQEREEQRQIKEAIREEEKARREMEKAIKEAEKEEKMLQKAMEKARKELEKASEEEKLKFEEQLSALQSQLEEAEAKNQRAISMAQQTRRGHVYVISNVGSFGEDIHKIGLTRRLEPMDRVKELGDASVPFDFDVHAMIYSEDAPKLEKELHKVFELQQVNKVNYRKEFFRVNVSDIKSKIDEMDIEAHWTMKAEAKEYRETLAIENQIDSVFDYGQHSVQKVMSA